MAFEDIGQSGMYPQQFEVEAIYVEGQTGYENANEAVDVGLPPDGDPYGRFDTDILNEEITESGDFGETPNISPEEMLYSVAGRLDKIDTTLAPPLYEAIYEATVALDDRKAEGFYEAVDREIALLGRETTEFERLEANYRVLRRYGGRAPAMETDETRQLVIEAAELRNRVDSLSVEIYMEARDELIGNVDWLAAIKDTVQKGPGAIERLAKLFGSLNKYDSPALREGYKNTMRWTSSLEYWRERFAEGGHVLDDDIEQAVPDDWRPDAQLVAETYQWRQAVDAITSLICSERASSIRTVALQQADMEAFEAFFLGIGMEDTNPNRDGVPAPVAYAFEQYIKGKVDAVYEADRNYRERPVRRPMEVRLGAYEDTLRMLLGDDDPEHFIKDILRRFPASLIRHMGAITCEDNLPLIKYPNKTTQEQAASMDGEEHRMRLNMSPEVQVGMVDVHKGISPSANSDILMNSLRQDRRERNRTVFREVVDHEVVHHIIQETGPLEWMVRLHRACQSEQVDVSKYVTDSRMLGSYEGQHEDYAVSGAQYMNHPWSLHDKAAARFKAFHQLINRYSEDELWVSEAMTLDHTPEQKLLQGVVQDLALVGAANTRARYGVMSRR